MSGGFSLPAWRQTLLAAFALLALLALSGCSSLAAGHAAGADRRSHGDAGRSRERAGGRIGA